MIVILEGTERCGKTTIAKEFEKQGFINFKDIVRDKRYETEYMNSRYDAILNFLIKAHEEKINIVIDRFHISQIVNSILFRNSSERTQYKCFYMDAILNVFDSILVLVDREIDENYISDYSYVRKNKLKDTKKMYEYYFDKSEIKNKVVIESTNDENEISKKVKKIIRKYSKYDFYLASPFFNDEQVERERRVRNTLRSVGFRVYAPIEHGIVSETNDKISISETFKSNIDAIRDSSEIIAITDGKDMGTIWEAGYAFGIKKPIVYYAETLGDNPFNIMLAESGKGVVRNEDDLLNYISERDFYFKEITKYE